MWPGNWSRLSDILTPGCFLHRCSHGGAELVPKEHLFSSFLPSLNSHCRKAAIGAKEAKSRKLMGAESKGKESQNRLGNRSWKTSATLTPCTNTECLLRASAVLGRGDRLLSYTDRAGASGSLCPGGKVDTKHRCGIGRRDVPGWVSGRGPFLRRDFCGTVAFVRLSSEY